MQLVRVDEAEQVAAPDGSQVRVLSSAGGGSMILCTLHPGAVTRPVRHRTVEELWYCMRGRGWLWRSLDGRDETVSLEHGVSASIPVGAAFQFRCDGADEPLEIVIVTTPPWPGEDEAVACDGPWEANV